MCFPGTSLVAQCLRLCASSAGIHGFGDTGSIPGQGTEVQHAGLGIQAPTCLAAKKTEHKIE